ncbi:MAG: enoyl-CoA hydratase-related protein [Acidimicrobiales bacterium]
MSKNVLRIEVNGPVSTVYLDRGEKRNAMGPEFFDQLAEAMEVLSSNPDVRCVVIAAEGTDFSVGLDLKALADGTLIGREVSEARSQAERAMRLHERLKVLQQSISSVSACSKPVIAAVWGNCLGSGLDLASACDIRIAAADAMFALAETRMAMVADLGSLQRLPQIIGKGHLAEIAFTGKQIPASAALGMGLVNKVCPDASSTLAAATKLAGDVALNSPLAVQGVKAIMTASDANELADGLQRVALWNAAFIESDDLAEAVAAFIEKRPPVFRGS